MRQYEVEITFKEDLINDNMPTVFKVQARNSNEAREKAKEKLTKEGLKNLWGCAIYEC